MKRVTRKHIWPVAVEGIAGNFVLGAMFTWAVFRTPLQELFPSWTNGMLSIVFAMHNLFICIGILIGGRLAARMSMRVLYFLLSLVQLIGFGSFAFLPESNPGLSYAMVLCLFGMLCSFAVGIGINVVQTATQPWFPSHTGRISGALFMALGISSFILAAVTEQLLDFFKYDLGLGTACVKYTVATIGVILFIIAMLTLILDPKSWRGPANAELEVVTNSKGITPRMMVRMRPFWLLLFWNAFMRAVGFILLDYAANLAVAFAATSLMGMLISPANGLGSLLTGMLLDKVGLRPNILTVGLTMALSIALLAAGGLLASPVLIIIGLMVGGLAYGGSSTTDSASIKRVFGGRHYSVNYGIANISMAIGAGISSLSGIVLDAFGGNYLSIIVMTAILVIPVIICSIGMTRVRMPRF
ncbi:MAG: MFS transporter [Oscillospiraceae bacterium]|nr:MFS transporter [Oscillospiraceae bacterium]